MGSDRGVAKLAPVNVTVKGRGCRRVLCRSRDEARQTILGSNEGLV